MHHLRSRTGWVSIDIRLAYQTPRRAMSFRDRRILGHPPQSMSNRFALDLFRPTNSSSSGDAPVEHLGPGAPRSKEGSSRPLDRSFGFRRSIAAFRPEHLGSTPIEPDGSGFRNRSTPVRSQSNHRDNLIPSGTSFHVGRSNGPPWSSGARKGWHLRQPGRRVLERKPCRFDPGFRPFLHQPSKPNRVDVERMHLRGISDLLIGRSRFHQHKKKLVGQPIESERDHVSDLSQIPRDPTIVALLPSRPIERAERQPGLWTVRWDPSRSCRTHVEGRVRTAGSHRRTLPSPFHDLRGWNV